MSAVARPTLARDDPAAVLREQVAGVADRHACRVRVAAVGDHLDDLRRTAVHPFTEAARNGDRQPGTALVEVVVDLVRARDDIDNAEGRRRREPCDDVAAGGGTVGVDDQHRDFPDVGGGRVGEQEQLEDRRDDHDEQQTRISSELDHLLPHQESGAPHVSSTAGGAGPTPASARRPSTPRGPPGRARRHRRRPPSAGFRAAPSGSSAPARCA